MFYEIDTLDHQKIITLTELWKRLSTFVDRFQEFWRKDVELEECLRESKGGARRVMGENDLFRVKNPSFTGSKN